MITEDFLHSEILRKVDDNKYLGSIMTNDLSEVNGIDAVDGFSLLKRIEYIYLKQRESSNCSYDIQILQNQESSNYFSG